MTDEEKIKAKKELAKLQKQIGEIALKPIQKIIYICAIHPEVCYPIYIDTDPDIPGPNPTQLAGEMITTFIVQSMKVPEYAPNKVLPGGIVVSPEGTWNIKENPAIKGILTKKQNAEIALTQIKQNIAHLEKNVAIQKMIVDKAEEQLAKK